MKRSCGVAFGPSADDLAKLNFAMRALTRPDQCRQPAPVDQELASVYEWLAARTPEEVGVYHFFARSVFARCYASLFPRCSGEQAQGGYHQ